MTTCRLIVQTPEGVWQGEVDSWTALVVLAALSAEPESFEELAAAVRRYQPEHRLFAQARRAAPEMDVADGSGCLIDLVGRTVVAGTAFELPDPRGAYKADADEHAEGFPIVWLDTPADWLFRKVGDNWREVVAARAAARAAVRRLDVRAVLFGSPLLEHLAHGVLEAADDSADEERRYERTLAVHADWLLTARADLGGRTPREVLLAERTRIDRDLHHRSDQWGQQRHAPAALAPDSMAYRLGGFGTTEVVLYFDLVRALLAEAWELAKQQPKQAVLVERLVAFRDRWLRQPCEGISMLLTPAELIDSERRRLPIASDGSHLFDDCPICQAEAEGDFGPSFMFFDGHHLALDDEFAFSLFATRDEWEREQEDYRRFSEEFDRKQRERVAAGGDGDDPLAGSVWRTSFVDWDTLAGPNASPQQMLWTLSFPLSEVVGTLQDRPDSGDLWRSLNAAYGALRTSQDAVATESAARELRELLEVAGQKVPDLLGRCADLQSRLDEVLRRFS